MIRSQRILNLIELLTTDRNGFTAKSLADKLNVSERTIFRDIQTLRSENYDIAVRENGGFYLNAAGSPLSGMFRSGEIEALLLGAQWVAVHGDARLKQQAERASAKLLAMQTVLQQEDILAESLLIAPKNTPQYLQYIDAIKAAIKNEHKISIAYRALNNDITQRILWPFSLAYYEDGIILIAWCELRHTFRHFRCDRIDSLTSLSMKYPNTRTGLYQLWLESQINAQGHDKN